MGDPHDIKRGEGDSPLPRPYNLQGVDFINLTKHRLLFRQSDEIWPDPFLPRVKVFEDYEKRDAVITGMRYVFQDFPPQKPNTVYIVEPFVLDKMRVMGLFRRDFVAPGYKHPDETPFMEQYNHQLDRTIGCFYQLRDDWVNPKSVLVSNAIIESANKGIRKT